MIKQFLLSVLVLMTVSFNAAHAEQKQTFGDIEVHYNAFYSTFLQPDMAAKYEVTRSRQYALMNVSVLNVKEAGKPAIKAFVTGEMKNLIGQVQPLKFRQIEEGDAVYYLANFRFNDDDIINFTINVQPDPNKPAQQIKFSQRFFVN